MTAFSRLILSGSTNGKPIAITATSGTGTTIHTAVTGTTSYDEIYCWASNVTASTATLTMQWGATTTAGLTASAMTLSPNGIPVSVMSGQMLNNSLTASATASTSGGINITGYVNRIA